MPQITIRHLRKSFVLGHANVVALDDVNLAVHEGEFCCLVGPSGCGKTTLLRILSGLERQTSGEVHLQETDPTHPRKSSRGGNLEAFEREDARGDLRPLTAMVFQEQSIFPWMTVAENVSYGLRMQGKPLAARKEITQHYLEKVGLARFAHAFPHQLSGGMKQRVSVARAFAADPQILLMDEPFANVDEQTRALLQEELLRIWGETRKTVVYITHSIDEALVLGDRVLVMTARPGRVKAEVIVDLPRPRSVYGLKSTPAFGALVAKVWEPLRQEVLSSFGSESAYGRTND